MPVLAELLAKLPKSKEIRMSAQGHALWISWQTELDPSVPQTLQNYGGMALVSSRHQSLWFFFSTDVFLALARLSVWARFNELNVTIMDLPAKLMLGVKREISLDVDTSLARMEVIPGEGLELWIHPKTHETGINIPGIHFEKKSPKQGLVNVAWAGLVADARLPYTSSHGWYALLRPLGNPLDKAFQAGWGHMYSAVEKVLQENKFKYLLHENYVIVAVDNLRQLRVWLRDMLNSFSRVKKDQHDEYWPCVSVVIDRKGLNFSNDLPKKVGLLWDNLMPDFPYMSYRTAYLLGDGFAIQDLRFSDRQTSMDSWCNVALDDGGGRFSAIPVLMASNLTTGGNGCFYCGVRSHEAHQCPTMRMPTSTANEWWELAGLSLESINEGFRHIERTLSEKGIAGYQELLPGQDPSAIVLRALFDINSAAQLRSVSKIWLSRGREFGKAPDDATPQTRDDSSAWDYLDSLMEADEATLATLDKNIQTSSARNPREARLRTLQGFVAINRNDPVRAQNCFKEAAALTTSPPLQAWNEYLQARLAECQGHLAEAIAQYEQIQRVLPAWKDLEYRQIVCKVKLGFAEQILGQLLKLVREEPTFFNRCLVDPEMGRGQLLILTSLFPLWEEAQRQAEAEKANIQELSRQAETWFPSEHPLNRRIMRDIKELQRISEVKNYIAFLQVTKRRPILEKEIQESIQREIEELQERYKHYLTALQGIRDEASWFPFPSILREFSREFNESAGIINWAFASNFNEAETFQRAQASTVQLDKLLRGLRKRLRFLRMVRDVTLFILTLGKTFFWIEIIGLLICLLGVPGIVLYGEKIKMGWLREILQSQQWEVQKVLLLIITVISFGLAALRSTIVFDKKRDKLIEEARAQREHLQSVRLERIRRQREAEAIALAREKKKEAERQRKKRALNPEG